MRHAHGGDLRPTHTKGDPGTGMARFEAARVEAEEHGGAATVEDVDERASAEEDHVAPADRAGGGIRARREQKEKTKRDEAQREEQAELREAALRGVLDGFGRHRGRGLRGNVGGTRAFRTGVGHGSGRKDGDTALDLGLEGCRIQAVHPRVDDERTA